MMSHWERRLTQKPSESPLDLQNSSQLVAFIVEVVDSEVVEVLVVDVDDVVVVVVGWSPIISSPAFL